ncbi:MAG: diguanylate cyclase [Mycetocola sp.]
MNTDTMSFDSSDETSPHVQQTTSPLSDGLLALALESVSEGSLITDAQQRIIYANSAITAITGYSAAEMMGKNCAMLQGEATDPATVQRMRDSFRTGETFRGDVLNYRKDGTPFWNALTITPLQDATGTTTHFVSVQRDISPLIDLQDRLRHQATHDSVTALPNRNALNDHLVAALARGASAGTSVAVGVIDLDDFKTVNDTFGHAVGDAVLREFAQRVSGCIRSNDMLARIGGDEFVIVIEGIDPSGPLDCLSGITTRVDAALAVPVDVGNGVVVVQTQSMGVALSPGHGTLPVEILRVADETLYGVKARKGQRAEWWELAALDG